MIKKIIRNSLNNLGNLDEEKIRKKIEGYDVISFDIFDTLIKRDVRKPTDIFLVMEHLTQIHGFAVDRMESEKEARRNSRTGEVNLTDIYHYLSIVPDKKKKEMQELEKKLELELCVQNKELYPIYKYCVKNKRIILISDMYLDRGLIEKILKKNGFCSYEKLYISNEHNMTKGTGDLYEYVKKDFDKERMIHIGNSFRADFCNARKKGLYSIKVPTDYNRLLRKYKIPDDTKSQFNWSCLKSFCNNHVEQGNYYTQFGYECFGPLLFGFTLWLFERLKQNKIKKVYFFSRDGFIMKKAYEEMGFDREIPAYYLEVSRRSLRVPTLTEEMGFEEVFHRLNLLGITDFNQIFENLGLVPDEHCSIVKKYGFDFSKQYEMKDLGQDQRFIKLYDEIKPVIVEAAEKEKSLLEGYLKQYDFQGEVGIVDIGWSGSMQKYLTETIRCMRNHPDGNLHGYYMGLTDGATDVLDGKYAAEGYLFDAYNKEGENKSVRGYVGLFETLFLEQDGSVKKYERKEAQYIANRYPYEYFHNGSLSMEGKNVQKIQKNAIKFIQDMKESNIRGVVGFKPEIVFHCLEEICTSPGKKDIGMFESFTFYNNGSRIPMVDTKGLPYYLLHPYQLLRDMRNSQWRIAFLKKTFWIPLPYAFLFEKGRAITQKGG